MCTFVISRWPVGQRRLNRSMVRASWLLYHPSHPLATSLRARLCRSLRNIGTYLQLTIRLGHWPRLSRLAKVYRHRFEFVCLYLACLYSLFITVSDYLVNKLSLKHTCQLFAYLYFYVKKHNELYGKPNKSFLEGVALTSTNFVTNLYQIFRWREKRETCMKYFFGFYE